jgi:hypothetical protein
VIKVGAEDKSLVRNQAAGSSGILEPQGYVPALDLWKAISASQIGANPDIFALNNVIYGKTTGGVFVPVQVGVDGAVATTLTGSSLAEQLTESDDVAGVLTFSANISTIEIYNTDGTNAGVFTVNGIDITVPAGKVFKSAIGGTPSNQVTITGATTYIVSRYV